MSGIKGKTCYWDSCIFISWLQNENRPAGEMEGVREMASRIERGRLTLVTSALSYAEISTARLGVGVKEMFDDVMKRRNVLRVAVDMKIARFASDLRDFYLNNPVSHEAKSLSTPDAVHLATAIIYKVDEFNTFDSRGRNKTLGLLPLSGNIAGHNLLIKKPDAAQGDLGI